MPIKPENRHYYKTPLWRHVCELVDKRAQGRCERCGSPNGLVVARLYGTREPGGSDRLMYWRLTGRFTQGVWINQHGDELKGQPRRLYDGDQPAASRSVRVVLTHAHLDQNPGNNSPENVALLCQWCHNSHDAPHRAQNAQRTRMAAKDGARPLLARSKEGAHCAEPT